MQTEAFSKSRRGYSRRQERRFVRGLIDLDFDEAPAKSMEERINEKMQALAAALRDLNTLYRQEA